MGYSVNPSPNSVSDIPIVGNSSIHQLISLSCPSSLLNFGALRNQYHEQITSKTVMPSAIYPTIISLLVAKGR